MEQLLANGELLELKRMNTPTLYNGWEQITGHDRAGECFNLEQVTDYMPQMGTMAGYAVTLIIEPGNIEHVTGKPDAWCRYREYMASVKGPKIVVVQDLDKPDSRGSFWGEVNANVHKALGCVGTITDGAIRDLDEMNNAGFKGLARRLCVGHAFAWPLKWNCEVEVFGTRIKPGQLIVADKHGFLAIPDEDQDKLLDAARFMDTNECSTVISAARSSAGKSIQEILDSINDAEKQFRENVRKKFNRIGEW